MKRRLFTALAMLLTVALHAADLLTLPEGVEAEEYTLRIVYSISQSEGFQDTNKEFTTKVAFNGNDVYVAGLAYYFPTSYVRGTLKGNTISFPSGQYVGEDMYGEEYITGYNLDGEDVVISDFELEYDAETRILSFPGTTFIAETSLPNDGVLYAYVKAAVFTPGALPPLVGIEPPAGLKSEPFLLLGTRSIYEENDEGEFELKIEPYEIPVQIGFDGNDLYIQGMVENVDYAWAKATKDEQGKYVIPVGQYIGTAKLYNQVWNYFLSGVNRMGGLTDITFTYDAETQTLSTAQTVAMTATEGKSDSYYTLNNVTIKKIEEREATPSIPQMSFYKKDSPYGSAVWYFAEIFVSLTDTEGYPMLSDKLNFVFLSDKGDNTPTPITFPMSKYYMLKEDITEIPYSFTDGLDISRHTVYFEKLGEDVLKTWKRLGLQSIYRGNGIEHRSDICWLELDEFLNASIPQFPNSSTSQLPNSTFDLQGRHVGSNAKGLVLQRVLNADGTVRTVKRFK